MQTITSLALLATLRAGHPAATSAPPEQARQRLSADSWSWQAKYSPFTGDDRNRMERPSGTCDWSREAIEQPRKNRAGLEARFLRDVALYPFVPEEILAMGRQEWRRAVAFESYAEQRNRHLPLLSLVTDAPGSKTRRPGLATPRR